VKYHLASGLILGTLIGPVLTRVKVVWCALQNQPRADGFNWVGLVYMGCVVVVCSGLVCVGSKVLDGLELLLPVSTSAVLPPGKADCHNASLALAIISSKSTCTLIEFHMKLKKGTRSMPPTLAISQISTSSTWER
jgi:hypothetical protein